MRHGLAPKPLPYPLKPLGRTNVFPGTVEQRRRNLTSVGSRLQKWCEWAAARLKSCKKLGSVNRDATERVLRLLAIGEQTVNHIEITT